MKVKTSELIGAALDWAVAKALRELRPVGDVTLQDGFVFTIRPGDHETPDAWHQYAPSTDWAQGGPIIGQEIDTISRYDTYPDWMAIRHTCENWGYCEATGPTPLIAAMRCYVASKLGDEIEIPGGPG